MRTTDFKGTEAYLEELRASGIKLGLENVTRLAGYCGVGIGSPELRKIRFIHLAGSNGKGSTGAMLEAMLRKTGHRTGFFSSPHLITPRERIRIGGRAVSEEEWCAVFDLVRAGAEKLRASGSAPTYFEFQTVMALTAFARGNVEWAVWETGLGGRLDSTNFIPESEYCVITGIALEHCAFLGGTVEKIAFEKGGIIKPGSRVFAGVMPDAAREVLEGLAGARGAAFHAVIPEEIPAPRECPGNWAQRLVSPEAGEFTLSLAGAMQRRNAALALKVWRAFSGGDDELFRAGVRALAGVRWPCRFERVAPGSVVDGGHNPDGIRAFAEACREAAARGMLPERLTLIFGAFADKDYREELEILAGIAGRMIFVPVSGDGGRPCADVGGMKDFWRERTDIPCETAPDALSAWERFPGEGRAVCGSLFLAGELIGKLFGPEAACNLDSPWSVES